MDAGLFMTTQGPYEHSNEQCKSTQGVAPIGSKDPKSGTHVSFGQSVGQIPVPSDAFLQNRSLRKTTNCIVFFFRQPRKKSFGFRKTDQPRGTIAL
jgi:hypothetical protein